MEQVSISISLFNLHRRRRHHQSGHHQGDLHPVRGYLHRPVRKSHFNSSYFHFNNLIYTPAESSAGPSTPRGAQTSLYAPAPSTPGAGPSTLHAADPFPDRLTATATAPDWNRIHHNIMPHGASNHEPPPWAAAANARYQREEDQRAERQRLAHQAEMERLERMGRGTPMPQRPGRDLVREATEAVRLRSQTPDGRRQLSQILIPKPADLKGKRRK